MVFRGKRQTQRAQRSDSKGTLVVVADVDSLGPRQHKGEP